MTGSSRIAKLAALSTAIIAHAALALALVKTEDQQIEGAGGAAEVRLGNSFADMAQGTLAAEPIEARETVEAVTPEVVARSESEAAEPVQPESAVPAETPTGQAERARVETASRADPMETAKVMPLQAVPPLKPEVAHSMAPAADPVARETVQDKSAAIAQPAERLTSAVPENATVSRSLRPQRRSAAFEERHKPTPQPKRAEAPGKTQTTTTRKRNADPAPKRQTKQTAQAGAQQAIRAGTSSGQQRATTRSSGSGGTQTNAGNAAASNYPGLVMRRISRAGRPRVNARGAAVVAFSIASGGRLASVSIARSSGSSVLDRAALRVVQSAAPFPKPPSGARRSFTIQIQGR